MCHHLAFITDFILFKRLYFSFSDENSNKKFCPTPGHFLHLNPRNKFTIIFDLFVILCILDF